MVKKPRKLNTYSCIHISNHLRFLHQMGYGDKVHYKYKLRKVYILNCRRRKTTKLKSEFFKLAMNFSKISCRKSLLGSIGITASANSCGVWVTYVGKSFTFTMLQTHIPLQLQPDPWKGYFLQPITTTHCKILTTTWICMLWDSNPLQSRDLSLQTSVI